MFGRELLVIYCLVSCSHCLYFHISEDQTRCFVQELADSIPAIISYKLNLYDPKIGEFMTSAPGYEMHFEVTNPYKKLMISRIYNSEGAMSFTSFSPGNHKICLYAKSTRFNWFSTRSAKFRLHIDIKLGADAIDYSTVAIRERFTEMEELRVYQLLEQVEQIQKEYNYQRYREEIFRDSCSSTNRYIIYCVLVQSMLFMAFGLWKSNCFRIRQTTMKLFKVLLLINL